MGFRKKNKPENEEQRDFSRLQEKLDEKDGKKAKKKEANAAVVDLFGDDSSDESDDEAAIARYDQDTDDTESLSAKAKEKEERNVENLLSKLPPEELFRKFDTDGSGFISPEEFIEMLPHLNINVSEAKAVRIFKTADKDGGGEIDLEEFKMALYACDPASGNTLGFTPSSLLTPKDAFDMFDADGTGEIDEDEFAEVLEYLGVEVSDSKQESMFKKYDKDKSGYISYKEFRAMWVRMANVKNELVARGVELPKYAHQWKLQQMLEDILDEEEKLERRALEEAKWWHDWQLERTRREKLGYRALLRSQDELSAALDASGQVYMLGCGQFKQFEGPPAARDKHVYEGYDEISKIWEARVNPTYERPEGKRLKALHQESSDDEGSEDSEEEDSEEEQTEKLSVGQKAVEQFRAKREREGYVRRREGNEAYDGTSPKKLNKHSMALRRKVPPSRDYSMFSSSTTATTVVDSSESGELQQEEEELGRLFLEDREYVRSLRFRNCKPMRNTVWLWGRRVVQGALSTNVAYALTDSGDIFTWGGRTQWWDPLEQESDEFEDIDQTAIKQSKMTPRSELQKLCTKEQLAGEVDMELLVKSEQYAADKLKEEEEEKRYQRMKRVIIYYEMWEPPPSNNTRMIFLKEVLVPKVKHEVLQSSLNLRGFDTTRWTKNMMFELLSECFELEIEVKGLEGHQLFKDAEQTILQLQEQKKKKKFYEPLMERLVEEYKEIRELHNARKETKIDRENAEKLEWLLKKEEFYESMVIRRRIQREDPFPERTSRGDSLLIEVSGLTPRGPPLKSPRGASAAWKISAGGHHASLLTHGGDLYTWGLGIKGRLGQGRDGNGRFNQDLSRPKRLHVTKGIPMKDVSCAFSHSCALSMDGKVYAWGSTASGKLGVGAVEEDYESFTIFPIILKFPNKKKIRQISCGSAHTGAVSNRGELYMWGCANGGRLGLGSSIMDSVSVPTLVRKLQNVHVWQVSCGNCHSALCTEVSSDTSGALEKITGGEVFVCGGAAAIGKSSSSWRMVQSLRDVPVREVSCGLSHTGLVSVSGEVYTWGRNKDGCTGHPLEKQFVPDPELLKEFHQAPFNLAIGKNTEQSSVYNNQDSDLAINGNRSGRLLECIHTQYDDRAWWQIDLSLPTVIESIRVWNRVDVPADPTRSRNEFTGRLFPFWIFISESPFENIPGKAGLRAAKEQSVAHAQFTKNQRLTEWVLPSAETIGQYVRIQLNSSNFLHVGEIEIFGTYSAFKYTGKVSSIECGQDVTMIIMRPIPVKSAVVDHYIRAIQADPDNALILRQYETFFEAYERYRRGDLIKSAPCRLCRAMRKCEVCEFYENTPSHDLPKTLTNEHLGLRDAINAVISREPPRLDWSEEDRLDEERKKKKGLFRRKSLSPVKSPTRISLNPFKKRNKTIDDGGNTDTEQETSRTEDYDSENNLD